MQKSLETLSESVEPFQILQYAELAENSQTGTRSFH